MSDLNGAGFGDKHDWHRGDTEQSPWPQSRSTLWSCRACKQVFRHYYHTISDIHAAMKQAGITEECGR